MRVSAAEQKELGEFGTWIGYSKDYGYYSTYAAPHIYTNQGVIAPPVDYYDGPYLQTHPTVLDENVEYVDGDVQGLWEQVYPTLTFSVKGESVPEMFDNLHAALAKYDIQPIYDKNTVGQMVADALKLAENFPSHYAWNGILLSSHENALNAYQEEKARTNVYESMFSAAKLLHVVGELPE